MTLTSLRGPRLGVIPSISCILCLILLSGTVGGTNIGIENGQCFVCGTAVEQKVVNSTNEMGSRDLDLRPAEMMRSTMSYWVHCCPECGYCAGRVDHEIDGAREVVRSDEYISIQTDDRFPELARKSLCYSLLLEESGTFDRAGWAALYAAWDCDDYPGYRDAAVECRLRAIRLFLAADSAGQEFASDGQTQAILLIDLLRRAEQYDQAAILYIPAWTIAESDFIRSILHYELELIRAKDHGRHTCGEVGDRE